VRVTTAFNRLLKLDGANVTDVEIGADTVTVEVRLRRRKLACPECEFTTRARYDTRAVASSWRHLRLGTHRLVVRARLRRLACPEHGVRVEGVGFARPGARFTRDFEQLVAWLATKMDKDALRRLVGIDWDTVGRICDRVVADELDPGRLDGLSSGFRTVGALQDRAAQLRRLTEIDLSEVSVVTSPMLPEARARAADAARATRDTPAPAVDAGLIARMRRTAAFLRQTR